MLDFFEVIITIFREPFCVGSVGGESLLLARFLIENNDQEYLEFDLERKNDIPVIKSIFKTLIGNYTILDEESEKIIKGQAQKVSKNIINFSIIKFFTIFIIFFFNFLD